MKLKRYINLLLLVPLTLTWNAPTTNTDGTPLTDLAGYKVYSGPKGAETLDSTLGKVLTFTKSYDILPTVSKCFYVTAFNTTGVESAPSNEGCVGKPGAPINLVIKGG